jgi:hypothetical protein
MFPGEDSIFFPPLGPDPVTAYLLSLTNFILFGQPIDFTQFASPIMDAQPANNGYNAFGGIPNAPAVVGSRTQDCYNNFHHTTAGKLAQLGSLTALTPADPEWKSNWEETLGLGTLNALLVGGAMHSEIGVISAVGHFTEHVAAKLATPVLFTATSVDTVALVMCSAGAVSSLGSGW